MERKYSDKMPKYTCYVDKVELKRNFLDFRFANVEK